MATKDDDQRLATLGHGRAVLNASPEQKKMLIEELAKTCSILDAVMLAFPEVKPTATVDFIEKLKARDPEFANDLRNALVRAQGTLEVVLYNHAVNGVEEDVWFMGKKVGKKRNFDHKLGLELAKRNARLLGDDSWQDKKVVEHQGTTTVQHEVRMENLSPQMRKKIQEMRKSIQAANDAADGNPEGN